MRNCVHCAVEIPPGLAPAPKILQQDRMAGSGLPSGIATSGAFPQEEVLSRSGWGLLLSAWSITRGPDGNLWFIDGDGDYMGRITPDGKITEFSGPPLPGVDSGPPAATAGIKIITAGPDGNLWFTDAGNNKIGRITVSK
jgi:hypothetical protein